MGQILRQHTRKPTLVIYMHGKLIVCNLPFIVFGKKIQKVKQFFIPKSIADDFYTRSLG